MSGEGWDPGEIVTRGPGGVLWLAYQAGGQTWSAAYYRGTIVQGRPGRWSYLDRDQHPQPLPRPAVDSLRACRPATVWHPPVFPRHRALLQPDLAQPTVGFYRTKPLAAFPFEQPEEGRMTDHQDTAAYEETVEPDVDTDLDSQVADALAGIHDPTKWFSKEDGLLVADLGDEIRTAGTIRLGHDGRLYRYHDGVYRPDGDTWAKIATRKALGFKIKRRHFDEILAYLRADEPFIPEHPPQRWINTRNGLLDWQSGELVPHSHKIPSAIQIPHRWNPDATCPAVTEFFQDVLAADSVTTMFEVVGYALYAGNPLSKAVLTVGPGGNGKSVLLRLVKALVGAVNTSAVPLQALGENRFAGAELYGRLANICGDLDARAIRRTDLFKQITGGDQVMAERKYAPPFNFTSFALPLFSANEPPITTDQSDAWFDRWLIIPMERRIRGTTSDDPHIDRRLHTPAELEGLLVAAAGGLRRLMDRGRFQPGAHIEDAHTAYRDRLDSGRAFIGEQCVLHDTAWVPRAALYTHYRKWSTDNGRLPVQSATFNDRIRRDYPTVHESGRKGIRGWAGLGLQAAEGAQP